MTRLEAAFGAPLLNPLNTSGPVLGRSQFNNKLFLPPSSILSSVCQLFVLQSTPNIHLSFISLLIIRGGLLCTTLLNLRSLILLKDCFLLHLSALCIPSLTIIHSLLRSVSTFFTKFSSLLNNCSGCLDALP